MAIPTFQWAAGGVPVSPEQAKRQRAIAEALIARSATPATNWGAGLADLASSYTGTVLNDRAGEAEAAGALEAGGLFDGLGSSSPEQDIIAALSNPWTSEGQQSVAQALLGQQFQQNDPMRQLQLQKLQQEIAGGGSDESFFGTPIFTQDANGNLSINQLGNQGSFNQVALPEGQTLAPPTKEVDTGTEIITFDRFGNELFRTKKDNYTPAYDAAAGSGNAKIDVETKAAADSLASKLPGLKSVVSELSDLAKKATYTMTGQVIDNAMRELGQEPTENAIARTKYIAMVDNQVLPLLRDTFGAAFTVKEGETLRATLGDPNKSPIEKQAILEAFIEQKTRDLEALNSRLPGGASGADDVDAILRGLGI